MRFLTAGESHGPQLTALLEGLPSQLELSAEDIDPWLALRQTGYGRGRRMQIETDRVQFMSGVRAGRTTGAPITLVVPNVDYRNWVEIMSPDAGGEPRKKALTKARPGHADLAGGIKYRHKDLRDVLERASARETTMRVATGAVALKLLSSVGIEGVNFVQSMLDIESKVPFSWERLEDVESSPVRCPDPEASARIVAVVDQAKKDGDTIGGVLEIRFRGLPIGMGSHVHWDRKLDGRIAQAVMSVQAVKGVEIGYGFAATRVPGSKVHDAIYRNDTQGYFRETNGAGGLEGGMTDGEELIVRVALKPIATLMTPLPTVDVVTKDPADAAKERSDTTAVPAAGVILQCVIGWVLADALLEKFGGDTVPEIVERVKAYREYSLEY